MTSNEYLSDFLGRKLHQRRKYNLEGIIVTPRDLRDYSAEIDANARADDFRYRGYPDGQFESPRNNNNKNFGSHLGGKAYYPSSLNDSSHQLTEVQSQESGLDRTYGLHNHFDTNKPKVFDSPQGLQYGSDGTPVNRPGPKPIRDPFKEKTSAEVLKYRLQQEEVERDIEKMKEDKKSKAMMREWEKKQDMEQLKNYHPWGKPGGGAPMGEAQKKKFTEVDEQKFKTEQTSQYQKELNEEYGDFHSQFGRPGAGAPMKTSSGRIRAEIKQDPDIRFQDTKAGRRVFEQEVRYRKPLQEKEPYSNDLENQMQEKRQLQEKRRVEELRRERDMRAHDPYGKPGGGAPNRRTSDGHRRTKGYNMQSRKEKKREKFLKSHSIVTGGVNDALRPEIQDKVLIEEEERKRDLKKNRKKFEESIKQSLQPELSHESLVLDPEQEAGSGYKHYPLKKFKDDQGSAKGAMYPELEASEHTQERERPIDQYQKRHLKIKEAENVEELLKLHEEEPGTSRRQQQDSQESFEFYDPWGKGAGQASRDKHGDVVRHKRTNPKMGFVLGDSEAPVEYDSHDPKATSLELRGHGGGAGAPIVTESGNVRARMPITLQRDGNGDAAIREEFTGRTSQHDTQRSEGRLGGKDPELQIYDPWGRGGAGAPMRDAAGNIQANVYGKMKNENSSGDPKQRKMLKEAYLHELQSEMEQQKMKKEESERYLKYGGGELATVMKQGQVGRPRRDPNTGMMLPHHLPQSDVTKAQTNTRSHKNEQSEMYHTELEKAAEERKRYSQLERLKDKQESKHHQSTMNDFWGRPGAGAPNEQNKKSKLDELLNNTPRQNELYGKKLPTGEDPYNCVKSTIPSTHVNMYQLDKPQRREAKKDYQLFTPFATDPSEEVY